MLLPLVLAFLSTADAAPTSLTVEVTVMSTKASGQPWDAFGGAPDILVCWTSVAKGRACAPTVCEDAFSCRTRVDVPSLPIMLEIYDRDLSESDSIGQAMCSGEGACEAGGRLQQVSATPTVAQQATAPLIGVLPASAVVSGCSCTFSFKDDAREGYACSGQVDESVYTMILGGKPVTLKPAGPSTVSAGRSVQSFSGGGFQVLMETYGTVGCPPNSLECEGTRYERSVKVTSDKTKESFLMTGSCGC